MSVPNTLPATESEITAFLAAFEDGSLPKQCWTHSAHLLAGAWYVHQLGEARALDHMRTCVQRYNEAEKPIMAESKAKMAEFRKIEDPAAREAAIEAWYQERSAQLPPATLADVVANIDHAVKTGGIDHVGIGTDFDGVGCVPTELSSYDKFPRLTRALLEKGYSAQDIEKIYGGNLLRVMRAVEQRARELKDEPPIESSIDRK